MFDVIDETKPQELEVIKHESNDLVSQAKAITIVNADTYLSAIDFLKTLKGMQKKAAETFDPIIKKAHGTWKEACNQKNMVVEPLEQAERLIKGKAIEYDAEQKRIAAEAQAKIDAQKRKEQEELLAKAKKAEEKGQIEKAENLMQQAQNIPAPVIEKEIPKVSGISVSDIWDFEVADLKLVPREYLILDEKMVRGIAKSKKGKFVIPGIRFFPRPSMSARG
ncbi:MAG: hypothetical protein PHD97_12335 [Bacteroidales bacterium]|nr:hypothetical protein [Bacteroidales bacterium]